MAVSIIRSLILYFTVVILYRIMGKRQIGEMQPSELVLAIMIADIASVPMESSSIPLVSGIVPIITLMSVEVILAFIAQKSNKLRKVITGTPSLVIAEGKLLVDEMEKMRFNIDDLMEQLRNSGYFDVSTVAFAVLETNGRLSVMPKEAYRPTELSDISQNFQPATFPECIIKDGKIDYKSLSEIGHNEKWLKKELSKNKIKNPERIFLLCADTNGITFIQEKGAN